MEKKKKSFFKNNFKFFQFFFSCKLFVVPPCLKQNKFFMAFYKKSEKKRNRKKKSMHFSLLKYIHSNIDGNEKEIEIPEKYFEKKMFLKNQQKQIKLYNKMEEVKKDN